MVQESELRDGMIVKWNAPANMNYSGKPCIIKSEIRRMDEQDIKLCNAFADEHHLTHPTTWEVEDKDGNPLPIDTLDNVEIVERSISPKKELSGFGTPSTKGFTFETYYEPFMKHNTTQGIVFSVMTVGDLRSLAEANGFILTQK